VNQGQFLRIEQLLQRMLAEMKQANKQLDEIRRAANRMDDRMKRRDIALTYEAIGASSATLIDQDGNQCTYTRPDEEE
jgi:hypothetical protein